MSESKSTYQQILKSTTLFGGVQVINILISIIRSKFIALFIGPIGMGISGLLMATLNLISGFSSLGLEISAIKFISEKSTNENANLVSKTILVLRKILWITGILGSLLVLILSPFLSKITFGNYQYSSSFAWISIALFFKQVTVGELAVLQGLQKLKSLAKANLLGSFFGLIISIPIYYHYKIQSIVPTIIVSSLTVFFFSWIYSRKIKLERVTVSKKEIVNEGKKMLNLGIMLSLSSMLTLLTMYLLQLYISGKGGLIEVGYYNAGFTLLNSYVGIIFSSMATDYFPRLSAVNNNPDEVSKIVSQQALIAVLIITPIIVLFEVFTPIFVRLLFSASFLSIVPMISFGILGMLFRAVSWSIGYIILAKGDSKIFVWNALGFNSLFLILHILGYLFFGLKGLGIAFLVYYFFHFLVLKILVKIRYQFYFNNEFYAIFSYSMLICLATFVLNYIEIVTLKYILFIFMILVSIIFSLFQLNKKINLKELIDKFTAKIKR